VIGPSTLALPELPSEARVEHLGGRQPSARPELERLAVGHPVIRAVAVREGRLEAVQAVVELDVLGGQLLPVTARHAPLEERVGQRLDMLVPERGILAEVLEDVAQVDAAAVDIGAGALARAKGRDVLRPVDDGAGLRGRDRGQRRDGEQCHRGKRGQEDLERFVHNVSFLGPTRASWATDELSKARAHSPN
jgi:hypothetical protein